MDTTHVNFTAKKFAVADRERLTAYARRHSCTVSEALSVAIGLLIERERGTSLLPPDSAESPATPAVLERPKNVNGSATLAEMREAIEIDRLLAKPRSPLARALKRQLLSRFS